MPSPERPRLRGRFRETVRELDTVGLARADPHRLGTLDYGDSELSQLALESLDILFILNAEDLRTLPLRVVHHHPGNQADGVGQVVLQRLTRKVVNDPAEKEVEKKLARALRLVLLEVLGDAHAIHARVSEDLAHVLDEAFAFSLALL